MEIKKDSKKRGRPRKSNPPVSPEVAKLNNSTEENSKTSDSNSLFIKVESTLESSTIENDSPNVQSQPSTQILMYKKLKSGNFRCKICKRLYTHCYKVKQHIKLVHGPRQQYKCAECEKTFRVRHQLTLHMNQHQKGSDYFFHCDKCDYTAKSKYYLKTHILRKHTDDYRFECDYCGKRFKMKMDLKFHLGTHGDSQHMCDACGRMYTSQDSLNKHWRVNHVNDYKFRCSVCNQKLLTQESLDKHIKKHASPHSCDQCELKFTKKHYLTRHKKRVHGSEKKNACKVCDKSFMCKATLRIHYLTHVKAKPYLCNVCGFSFTQRSSMMLHWKRKHPDAEEPPPPVILTNFFSGIEAKIDKLAQKKSDEWDID